MNSESAKTDALAAPASTNAPKTQKDQISGKLGVSNNLSTDIDKLAKKIDTPVTPKPPKPPVSYGSFDGYLAILAYLCGYLFLRLVRVLDLGTGVTVFTICFCAMVLWYRMRCSGTIPRQSWAFLGLVLAAALPFTFLHNERALSFCNLLFLMICAVYWISVLFETRLKAEISRFLAVDLISHFFSLSFGNMGYGFGALKTMCSVKKGRWRGVIPVLAALGAAFPLLLLVLSDLSAADDAFAHLVEQFFRSFTISSTTWQVLQRMLLAIPVGLWFFGLLFGAAGRRFSSHHTAEHYIEQQEKRRIILFWPCVAVLGVFCSVYLVFLTLQGVNLAQALTGRLSDGFSYSEYARQGFFELCRVAVINLLLLGVIRRYGTRIDARLPRWVRVLDILLCLQTLVLIGIAFSKMGLYITNHGLTLLRVYTSWFMVLLAVVFLLMLLSSFRQFCVHRWVAATFCILFLLLCWCNVGGIIASHNISRLQSGKDDALDTYALYSVATAAAPMARTLYNTADSLQEETSAYQLLLWAHDQATKDCWGNCSEWTGDSIQSRRAKYIAESTIQPPGGSWNLSD